jgi:hypothetical protein
VQAARKKAEEFIAEDVATRERASEVWAFGDLPEGSRSNWADCRVPELREVFKGDENTSAVQQMLGSVNFESHKGVGSVTFAPRFQGWKSHPPGVDRPEAGHVPHLLDAINKGYIKTKPAYDLGSSVVKGLPNWSQQFLQDSARIGAAFAPCKRQDGNWHIDGWDCYGIAQFDMIWGTFLTPLPQGNMGNLIVYPGSHYTIADILKKTGAKKSFWFDARKGEPSPDQKMLPSMAKKGISDGEPYEVLGEPGDVVMMHPWLAHGIGMNVGESPRLAVYVRVSADGHHKRRNLMKKSSKADDLAAKTWTGDMFHLTPGVLLGESVSDEGGGFA